MEHNLTHPGMASLMLEEIIKGKNLVGRPWQSYETQIMKDTEYRIQIIYFRWKGYHKVERNKKRQQTSTSTNNKREQKYKYLENLKVTFENSFL